jgi:hypothetical protein
MLVVSLGRSAERELNNAFLLVFRWYFCIPIGVWQVFCIFWTSWGVVFLVDIVNGSRNMFWTLGAMRFLRSVAFSILIGDDLERAPANVV